MGPKLGSVAQLATDPDSPWGSTTVHTHERTQTVRFLTVEGLWEPLGPDTPVRVIIVREHNRPKDKPAAVLLTTKLDATPTQTIERYADRRPIEVCFQQAKQPFGVVTPATEPSTPSSGPVPLQFPAMSLTIAWYALHDHHPDIISEHRQHAPWYPTKTTPSFTDMLAPSPDESSSPPNITQAHTDNPQPQETNLVQQA